MQIIIIDLYGNFVVCLLEGLLFKLNFISEISYNITKRNIIIIVCIS